MARSILETHFYPENLDREPFRFLANDQADFGNPFLPEKTARPGIWHPGKRLGQFWESVFTRKTRAGNNFGFPDKLTLDGKATLWPNNLTT
jgi:hypothetical protein